MEPQTRAHQVWHGSWILHNIQVSILKDLSPEASGKPDTKCQGTGKGHGCLAKRLGNACGLRRRYGSDLARFWWRPGIEVEISCFMHPHVIFSFFNREFCMQVTTRFRKHTETEAASFALQLLLEHRMPVLFVQSQTDRDGLGNFCIDRRLQSIRRMYLLQFPCHDTPRRFR